MESAINFSAAALEMLIEGSINRNISPSAVPKGMR